MTRLLAILDQDQQEVRAQSQAYKRAPTAASTLAGAERLTRRSLERAKRMLAILEEIGEPTIDNIGADGSQAISVLALHSRLSIMKRVLRAFEACYDQDPASVYHEAIPSLTDRVLIIERKEQHFGTQWMLGADGKFFLPTVEDFARMNQRRAAHGLGKAKHPVDLTYGVPKRKPSRPDTHERDQRPPTQEEYDAYIRGSLG